MRWFRPSPPVLTARGWSWAAVRRLSPLALALLGSSALATPALAGGGDGTTAPPNDNGALVIDAAADSITASGYQPGAAELRVTRPDAITGEPVLIGLYTDAVQANVPLTINTTAPVNGVGGDCWEGPQNSLLGWTPDIRAGDTVRLRADTVVVPPSAGDTAVGGPAAGCEVVGGQRANAPYARNAVSATSTAAISSADVSSPLTVSGAVQPFATSVAVTLTDGVNSTPATVVTPVQGAWSAAFAGADVARLADGELTVRALYTVPDLETGALHQIAGAQMRIAKDTRVAPGPATGTTPALGGVQPGGPAVTPARSTSVRIERLSIAPRVRLARARRSGLRLSLVVPDAARAFEVEVRRGARSIYRRTFRATPGRRQTVRLDHRALRRALRRGPYVLTVRAGLDDGSLSPAVNARVRIG